MLNIRIKLGWDSHDHVAFENTFLHGCKLGEKVKIYLTSYLSVKHDAGINDDVVLLKGVLMGIKPQHMSGRDVKAVLGPTNTGKTHLAIERLLAYDSGLIGLPLRLLAREVYQRLVERVGVNKVSLITGEEKISPTGACYSVCTVEALPRTTAAAFVAIDEVQLAGDLERGHVFTDRILHLRGQHETMLLGAATMQPILESLLPGLQVINRPRFSTLQYVGAKKITRLQRRSAIVAFSVEEVYTIAELIRRQRGGAAVVMGALSPRTRNAQVALYQSGDVDFLIATDAIGMGLNLDVDHVAFAQLSKFDGFQYRNLNEAELAQIAGRAGRYMRDGTFGVTGRVSPLNDDVVKNIESNKFEAVKVLQWRTDHFDFSSLKALMNSIEAPPTINGLVKALPATDARALAFLARIETVRALATSPERVALLWDSCALPDYRKIAPAQHADIVAAIYSDLVNYGAVDETYIADQVAKADRTDGNIDTLSQRIAQIRTWTFVSHRPGWLTDQQHWQEKTREIEDRLSDALHERLTKRFVDRRTSVLMKRLREKTMMDAEISQNGDVLVEGHHVGKIDGFRFHADSGGEGADAKVVQVAANKILAGEYDLRAERFAACANSDLSMGSDGIVRWLGQAVASLTSTEDMLKPRAIVLADEQLSGAARDKVVTRIDRFVGYHFETALKPLFDLINADALIGITRGIAFQLVEHFGILPRRMVAQDIKALDQISRAALRRLGVRFGAFHIFLPMMLKPAPAAALTLLWALKNDSREQPGYRDVVDVLAAGRTSIVVDPSFEKQFYALAGYRIVGRRAVRVDILERLADLIRLALSWKPGVSPRPAGAFDGKHFIVTPAMMSILGATVEDMEDILRNLGYRFEARPEEEITKFLTEFDQQSDDHSSAPSLHEAEPVGNFDDKLVKQRVEPRIREQAESEKSFSDPMTSKEGVGDALTEQLGAANNVDVVSGDEILGRESAERAVQPSEIKIVQLWHYRSRQDANIRRNHGHGASKQNNQQSTDATGPKKPFVRKKMRNQDNTHGKKQAFNNKKTFNNDRKSGQALKTVNPDSPFAALASLREQLKK